MGIILILRIKRMKLLSLFTLSAFGQGWNQQAVPISAPAPQQQGMNPMMMSLLLGKDSSMDPMTMMMMMGGGGQGMMNPMMLSLLLDNSNSSNSTDTGAIPGDNTSSSSISDILPFLMMSQGQGQGMNQWLPFMLMQNGGSSSFSDILPLMSNLFQ